ncbi:MAG: hypothetical protein JO315_15185 [Acidobacteria bacterium]|nr:hypothetical protein [Acidobacteriota bacterium]
MSHECTRRSLLQLLGITIGAAAIPARARTLDVEPSRDEPIEAEQPLSSPTRLERFIRSHGIKPAHLARESGYSRQHLLRLRFGRMRPSLTCIAALVVALRRLTQRHITAKDLFEPGDIHLAWREVSGQHEEHDHEQLRAAFGRRTLLAFLNGARS